jgi:peptide alpha-N-acetyltransferase
LHHEKEANVHLEALWNNRYMYIPMFIESFQEYQKACPDAVTSCVQWIVEMCGKDLSEPYSIYTFRYFLYMFPEVCLLMWENDKRYHLVGVVVGRLERHVAKWAITAIASPVDETSFPLRGYIAMVTIDEAYRRQGLGLQLTRAFIERVGQRGAHEIVLETEVSNVASLRLYQRLGLIKDKRLLQYYLNGKDAFRLRYGFRV